MLSLFGHGFVQAETLTLMAGGDVLWTQDLVIPPFDKALTQYSPSADHNPFQQLAPTLQSADFTFINLESPMTDVPLKPLIWAPSFRTPESFIQILKTTGIDAVSTANNHALDTGILGLQDTLETLERAHILAAGTGKTLRQARQPIIFEKDQIKVALLAYTEPDNSLTGFATASQAGVSPLVLDHIIEDIQAVETTVDYVVLSLHWGQTSQRHPSPQMRAIAHDIIEAGGDVILGHHPHVPQGIELYQNKPIIYSLGNLVFPYSRPSWGDNILVRLRFTPDRIKSLEVLPIAGRGESITQPYVLSGQSAQQLLETIQAQSAQFNTTLDIQAGMGYIKIPTAIEISSPQPAALGKNN